MVSRGRTKFAPTVHYLISPLRTSPITFSVLFFGKHCICVHRSYFDFVDMPSLRSARYICLAANSICFRFAQARYDIDPRSRSEHIECVSTYRTRQRISKMRASGSISTRSVLKGTTLSRFSLFAKCTKSAKVFVKSVKKEKQCLQIGNVVLYLSGNLHYYFSKGEKL